MYTASSRLLNTPLYVLKNLCGYALIFKFGGWSFFATFIINILLNFVFTNFSATLVNRNFSITKGEIFVMGFVSIDFMTMKLEKGVDAFPMLLSE